ncbi:MAG: MBL fold metallo-hydrolase [Blastocatellia bacterium]
MKLRPQISTDQISSDPVHQFHLRSVIGLFLLIVVLLPAHSNNAEPAQATSEATGRTQVVLLGTGTPNADPDRAGPSVAIVVDDTPYLVDFGPGVVRRASAAFRNGVKGLAVSKLRTAFATHLHSDHTVGLADLIFTPWVLERKEPLELYGPRGIRAMADHIVKAYAQDIQIRLSGGEPSNKTGWRVNAHAIRPGVVYKDSNVTVKAFPVRHGKWKESFGYRFETPDRVIVISGDCAPSEAVIDNCNGCDVLIHEVYSQAGFRKRPPEWQQYHAAYHTSTAELAAIAMKAKPKLLVLYHQLFWGTSEDEMLNEIRQGYSGKVVSGKDLDVY